MRILRRVYDWLAQSDAPQSADVIFVLAGRESRKRLGFKMFDEGWAASLLLSVGRYEIRRFADFDLPLATDLRTMAASIEPEQRHFFVKVSARGVEANLIPIGRYGTWKEILAFSQWLAEHDSVQTAMLVSSGFHLRRVHWCCSKLITGRTKLMFVAVPSEATFNRDQWWGNALSRKLVLLELIKVIMYPLLHATSCSELRSSGV